MKKIFGIVLAVVMIAVSLVMAGQPAMAVGGGDCGTSDLPLGLKPWYAGLCSGDEIQAPDKTQDGSDLTTFVWIAVLNVLFDLLLVAGYLAIGFIIYGGFQYIMAQGDPGRAAKGQRTITSAIIGMVIVLSASVLVNTIRVILSINGSDTWNQDAWQGDVAKTTITNAFNWAYTVAGIVAVAFIVKGSVTYLLSSGDPRKIHQATMTIIYAVIGLVVVLLAAAITNFVLQSTGGALKPAEDNSGGGTTNSYIIEERVG